MNGDTARRFTVQPVIQLVRSRTCARGEFSLRTGYLTAKCSWNRIGGHTIRGLAGPEG